VLRTLTALDRAPRPGHGPETYVTVARQVVPGSALSLLALALLLPPLVAAVDGFARARRRGQSAAAWLPWVVAGAAPWLAGLLAAKGLALLGLGPDLPPAAFPPVLAPLDVAGAALAGVAATVAALAFVAGSRLAARTRRARRDLATSGLGPAVALAVALLAVVTWLRNPWTALVLAPAANAWVVAGLLGPRARRAGATLVLVGLLGPLGVGLYYLDRLELGPLGGTWYAFALLVGGHVGPAAALLGALWLGALLGLVLVTGARIVQREPQAVRGVAIGRSVRAGRGGLVAGAPRRPVARHEPGVASRGRPR
jgi:hypothetical protein